MTDLDNRIVEFSTDHIPEKNRIALWREHYGHIMLRVDLEPARDTAFEARIASLALPGLQLMEASSSPAKVSRSGRYLADGDDDIVVAFNLAGSVNVASGGREQSLREGDAIVIERWRSVVVSPHQHGAILHAARAARDVRADGRQPRRRLDASDPR